MTSSGPRETRPYRSRRRADQARRTRRRVVAAATDVFLQRGFAGATMRAVADRAGVSVPTVESLFGTKARLLKTAIDVAIAGDDEPVAVLDRDWTEAAAGAATADELLAVVAGVIGPAQRRSAGLVLAVFEAAATDAGLAALAGQLTAQREVTAGWVVDQLTRKAPLGTGRTREEAVETVWILMDPAVFDRLVRRRHWTVERYQRWFAASTGRLLIGDTTTPEPPASEETPGMSAPDAAPRHHPPVGQIGYLQLPATDIGRSAAFYASVFGWSADPATGGFEAPGMIGQWITDRPPATDGGPVLWLCANDLYPTLERVTAAGGTVRGRPYLDGGERWLADIADPAGNRLGVVAPVRRARAQTLLAVRDVEASSRWYQRVLGLTSDHGGPHYERLLADGVLVLQLHHHETEHHHGRIADLEGGVGNGVMVWFGEVTDFDGAVTRARELGAPVVREPHRNPPEGEGNGPGHREVWIEDPDGYLVVIASPDGEAYEPE